MTYLCTYMQRQVLEGDSVNFLKSSFDGAEGDFSPFSDWGSSPSVNSPAMRASRATTVHIIACRWGVTYSST